NSSPEFTRKDYGNYYVLHCCICLCVCGSAGTELDDVKKLLKGRSSSVSPTRSSSASITLPVPKKASVETKTISYDTTVRSGQYDTLDSTVFPTFSWSTSTLPSSSTTVIAGNTSSYTYQSGQVSANNMAAGLAPVIPTSPSSLSGETKCSWIYMDMLSLHMHLLCSISTHVRKPFFYPLFALISKLCLSYISIYAFVFTGYGVQKNVTNGGSGISTGVSTTTRSQTDDAYKKDYKFVVSEKENVPAKRETDMLILAKDTGKQFTSSGIHVGGGSLSGDSIKKEKLISSYGETAQLKAETGNSYCESILKASPM
uniref:Uncharacterized protein n=1 Tax=Pundamilia nyererei TaxID=303518 RepID=A0A3B4FDJ3_9CICH